MNKKQYPFQNHSLEDLEGEEWQDVPGLDGYFRISNYGRLKRQRYEMQYRNGAIYTKPEKIIKLQIVKQPNKFKKDYTCFLSCKVTVNGKKYTITVTRLVYYCFVEPFDLKDQAIVIISKNTDNFDIRPPNLEMVTKSQKQQRVVARKRFKSPLLEMTDQARFKQRNSILETISRQVTQYGMGGKKIRTFPSAAEAERVTGVFATSIRKVASGKDISAGSFIWRWGKEQRVDVEALRQEKRKAYVEKYGQKVTQYDLSGRMIARYPCIKDAAEASGAHVNAINKVLKGEYKSARGCYWMKGYGNEKIDLSGHKWGRESMAMTRSKPVIQYSLEGKYLHIFSSVKSAAQCLGLSPASLAGALKGRQKTSGGFKWKYETGSPR